MRQGKYLATQRRRRRGKKIMMTVAFVLTVASIATVICLAMFFDIEEITASGATRYESGELIRLSGIRMGENIFAMDTRLAREAIYNACPYIDTVQVRRLLPTAVDIRVTETQPACAVVGAANQYTLLGDNGRVLQQVEDVSTEGVPLVVGVDFSALPEGLTVTQKELDLLTRRVANQASLVMDGTMKQEDYDREQQELERLYLAVTKLNTALGFVAAARGAGLEEASYYDVGDELSVTLLYDDRILLKLGSELELAYKLQFARGVIDELGDTFTGTVDLSTAGNNQKAYTREQDVAPLMNRVYYEGYY